MKTPLYIFAIITMICSIRSCDPMEWGATYYVSGINNSDDTLAVYLASGNFMYSPTTYPDTMLPRDSTIWVDTKGKATTISDWLHIIPPHNMAAIGETFNEKPTDVYRRVLPHDTLSIFYICKDTIDKYGYDDVAKNNRILVRYDLSVDEFAIIGDIPYPPSQKMRDMKMYPQYDTLMKEINQGQKP